MYRKTYIFIYKTVTYNLDVYIEGWIHNLTQLELFEISLWNQDILKSGLLFLFCIISISANPYRGLYFIFLDNRLNTAVC